MTGRRVRILDDHWQMAECNGHWYLQSLQPDNTWAYFAGPYKQYSSGVSRYRTITERQVRQARMAQLASGVPCAHPLEWRVTHWHQNRCALCGFDFLEPGDLGKD